MPTRLPSKSSGASRVFAIDCPRTPATHASIAPVGTLQQGGVTINARVLGAPRTLQELASIIITQTPTGGPILLSDVATVAEGYRPQTQIQRLNGQEAVGLSIIKQSDANALQVADDVRVALRRLEPLIPGDSKVVITNDSSV